jgi:hypothetical protein
MKKRALGFHVRSEQTGQNVRGFVGTKGRMKESRHGTDRRPLELNVTNPDSQMWNFVTSRLKNRDNDIYARVFSISGAGHCACHQSRTEFSLPRN